MWAHTTPGQKFTSLYDLSEGPVPETGVIPKTLPGCVSAGDLVTVLARVIRYRTDYADERPTKKDPVYIIRFTLRSIIVLSYGPPKPKNADRRVVEHTN